jgi:N-acetylmuramic acid 6-phosphate (MurNAc-6-P) etherase
MAVTALNRDQTRMLLKRANDNVKTAIVMQKMQIEYEDAKRRLEECGGFVRKVLES